MKVLIVEDEAQLRKIIITVLRRMFPDIDPWAAESVDEAIDHLKQSVLERQFDLVICDWDLLGTRKGGEVLEWIREHASHLERRFMFFSGNEAAQSCNARWLEKPAEISVLKATIAAVVAAEA